MDATIASLTNQFTPKRLELLHRVNKLCKELQFSEWNELSKNDLIELFSKPRCIFNAKTKLFCMHLMCELVSADHEVCFSVAKWAHMFGRGNLSDTMSMFKGAHTILRDMVSEDPCDKLGMALNKAMIDSNIVMPKMWYL